MDYDTLQRRKEFYHKHKKILSNFNRLRGRFWMD